MAAAKRKAVDSATVTPSPRRSSGRVQKSQVKYEESFSDVDDKGSDEDFESQVSVSENDISEVEEDSEAEERPKKKSTGAALGKDENERNFVIPQEKKDGGTPYVDERIHANTLEFLRDLKKNNVREWLKWHDKPFRQAENDFKSFVGELNTVICEKDPTVPELPIKDIIFRIYRDIRFSPDPTPYKSYFSVAWSRTGRKGPYAHYYLHIQPGNSFLGGGYWNADSATLGCLREDIDQRSHQLKSVLMGDKLRKCFFPVAKDEKKVIAAFCAMNAESALKTRPKGFDADHAEIALLKLRNFTMKKSISDKDMTSANALELIGDIVESLEPFITYLNDTVMP